MKHYKAPWSVSLVIGSCLVTVFCLDITIYMICFGRGIVSWVALLPVAVVAGAAPFTIRGYTVNSDAILVHRLFWATRLPLDGLVSAQFEPDAMRWSLRPFGNGGLFSITGFFRNKLLGAYAKPLHQITMIQGAALKGQLLQDGRPVADAEIRINRCGAGSDCWFWGDAVLTDDMGGFHLQISLLTKAGSFAEAGICPPKLVWFHRPAWKSGKTAPRTILAT